MKMSSQIISTSLSRQLEAVQDDIAVDITTIMREETTALKDEYRAQVTGAGMSAKLARTWQADIYPKGGRSLNPAGYIHSKAPTIIQSFVDGATIRPVNGAKWLWIPTKNVPKRLRAGNYVSSLGRRSGGSRMGPEEVELHFNAELSVVINGSEGEAYIDVVSGRSGGYREATAGRTRGRRGMAPRKAKPVLMFVLRRSVRMPRLFDLDAPAQRAAERIARRIAARWS